MRGPDALYDAEFGPAAGAGSELSWAWLAALAQSLSMAIEITDVAGAPRVTVGPDDLARRLRSTIDDVFALRDRIERTLSTGESWSAAVEGLHLASYRLTQQSATAGALLLSRNGADDGVPGEFEQIGPWLVRAVEAHLAKIGDRPESRRVIPESSDPPSFDRIASLHRILHDAIERGNERDVVTSFAESLFAWDGIELSGYVEDTQGRWMLAVTTPGSARGHATIAADLGQQPRTTTLTPLSEDDLERLGFSRNRRGLALQIGTAIVEPWVIVFFEGYAPLDLDRLGLYINLLREALGRAATIAETRTTWAILQPLLGSSDPIEPAIELALQELANTVKATSASLTVVAPGGTTVLAIGEQESSSVRPFGRTHLLVSSTSVAQAIDSPASGEIGTLALTLKRTPGQTFTRREQHLVDRAAQVLAAWLPGTFKAPQKPRERRAWSRDFEQVLDRVAVQTALEGAPASVVVVSVPGSPRGEQLQRWVADIRGQLRGSDLAGMLSDHEIGVRLSGTPRHDVPIVSARLQRCFTSDDAAGTVAIGSATRESGTTADDSLVDAARQNVRALRQAQA
jgi:hypothetical protein